jgi:APA family basic amino acid/polyamine antiporter
MMVFLPFDTWIRLILWMLLGHDIYVFYGSKHSKLGAKNDRKLLSYIGLSIAFLLLVFISAHQTQLGWHENNMFAIVLIIVSLFHIVLYGFRLFKTK